MSFTGGKLKLKGGDIGKRKKKRKSKDAEEGDQAGALVVLDDAAGGVAAVQKVLPYFLLPYFLQELMGLLLKSRRMHLTWWCWRSRRHCVMPSCCDS